MIVVNTMHLCGFCENGRQNNETNRVECGLEVVPDLIFAEHLNGDWSAFDVRDEVGIPKDQLENVVACAKYEPTGRPGCCGGGACR